MNEIGKFVFDRINFESEKFDYNLYSILEKLNAPFLPQTKSLPFDLVGDCKMEKELDLSFKNCLIKLGTTKEK